MRDNILNMLINTFFRQDFMRIGTQTALLYSKILPQLCKQCFIIFFVFFIESKREDIFFLKWGIHLTQNLPEMQSREHSLDGRAR